MSRLVRCIEGHIFEADKSTVCPICGAPTARAEGPLTAPPTQATPPAVPPPAGAPPPSPDEAKSAPTASAQARRPLAPVLYGGIAAVVIALATTGWWLRPASKPVVVADQHNGVPEKGEAREAPLDGKSRGPLDDKAQKQATPASRDGKRPEQETPAKETVAKKEHPGEKVAALDSGGCIAGAAPATLIEACGKLIEGGKLANKALAEAYYLRGGALRDGDKIDAALADLGQAIALQPQAAKALNDRAYLNISKNLDSALTDLDQAITLDPQFAEAYCNRGHARWYKGDLDGALADTNEAIRLAPDVAHYYVIRSSVDEAKQAWTEAITDSSIALEKKPLSDSDAEDAYLNRGFAYAMRKIYDRAIDDYSAALRVNPKSIPALTFRGGVYAETRRLDLAWNDFTEAIRIDPKSAIAYFKRGDLLQHTHRCEQAVEDFTAAIGIEAKRYEIPLARARCYLELNQVDAALADADAAVVLAPNEAEVYTARGKAWLRKGNPSRARADFGRVIERQPNNSAGYRLIATAEVALEQEAYAHCPTRDNQHALDLTAGGEGSSQLCLSGPQYTEALAALDEAIKRQPNEAESYDDRAIIYSRLKQYERAFEDYTAAIHINPKDAPAYNFRGNIYFLKQQYDAAIADFSAAIEIDSRSSIAYANRGSVYALKHDRARAISDLRKAVDLDQSNENARRQLKALGVTP